MLNVRYSNIQNSYMYNGMFDRNSN